jgi:MoaA/NifB/PqqE/SkfB family radical SAM enzyme
MSYQINDNSIKAILKIGYLCNYKCSFCHAETKKQIKDIAIKALFFKILLLKKKWVQTILLSGGESTLEKHFFQIVDFITRNGLSFGIVTNGSTIYHPAFLERLSLLGIKNIYLSIHGYKEVHNDIVGDPDSFNKVISIISNIRDNYPNIRLFLNYVVVRQNVDSIEATIVALRELEFLGLSIKFSFLEPEWAGDNTDLMISPRYATGIIHQAITTLSNQYICVYWDGFPICFFHDMLDKRADLQTENILYITEIYEHKIYNTDYGKRHYTEKCNTSCSLREQCYGIFDKYQNTFLEHDLINPLS